MKVLCLLNKALNIALTLTFRHSYEGGALTQTISLKYYDPIHVRAPHN
jgi:hypothetical protein